jgi:hypothetical protein
MGKAVESATLLEEVAAAKGGRWAGERREEDSCSTMVSLPCARPAADTALDEAWADTALDEAWLCLRVGGGTRHLLDQCDAMEGAADAGPETDQTPLVALLHALEAPRSPCRGRAELLNSSKL